MEAYVAGDAGAFERLFRSLAPSLRAFFARSSGPGAAADDLVQTTILRIHAARRSWRSGERLRPWAFTIAARVRVDWLRSRGRPERELEEAEGIADPAPAADPAEALVTEERARRVRAAVDRLPESQRVVVHLHRLEGMTFAEVGRVLGISEDAAKLRAFRAYAQLRSLLADVVSEEAP